MSIPNESRSSTNKEDHAVGRMPEIPSISLPKGGGAIRGIGEKFVADPSTGTASVTVPLATSPGRSDFTPQLTLTYSSGSGNGPFGFGWDLGLPAITRQTEKGLPCYRDEIESDVFILSGYEDLVPVLGPNGKRFEDTTSIPGMMIHRYRPRVEGLFARIERWTRLYDGDVHWRSISKDNILTIYGRDSKSRIHDPRDPKHVFSWLISETRDDKGNAIVYEYKQEDGTGVDLMQAHERNRGNELSTLRTANRYIKHIYYGNRTPFLDDNGERPLFLEPSMLKKADWMFEIVFDYGEHDADDPTPREEGDWLCRRDPFSSYQPGFEVRTYRLCQRVLLFHHFPLEDDVGRNCLVRSTDFTYRDALGSSEGHRRGEPTGSFLASVTQCGYKRVRAGAYYKRAMPPLEFKYSKATLNVEVRELDRDSLENLPVGISETQVQWVDLDGEGIEGILTRQSGEWFYKPNLGQGRFGPMRLVSRKPSLASVSDGLHQQLIDLTGDGLIELVDLTGAIPGFYKRTAEDDWEEFQPFQSLPNIPWDDPNLRYIDLDGDGRADVLITEDQVFTWYRSLGEKGYDAARHVVCPVDEETGPRLVFADRTQSIYTADMNGDGLTDLVRVRNGEVCYWPNMGHGRFGAKVTMDDAPLFDHPDQFSQNRIRLADIDGSGTSDLIYLAHDSTRIYVNESGNRWSEPRHLGPVPDVSDVSSVMTADLHGNDTVCLVWSSPLPAEATSPLRYIDLMGGEKPHLLVGIVNNLGAETRIRYAPSTKFYLRDKADGKPWITRLPFPVHVVERVETYDHISSNRFVTSYAYHHGYYDEVEREFRGFGMVEQWDTEEYEALKEPSDFPIASNEGAFSHVPPVYTKTWFHTGVYIDRDHISDFFAGLGEKDNRNGYYREPGLSDAEFRKQLLPDTHLPEGLTLDEEREACRALRGSMLRQEIYALDGSANEAHPYQIIEQNFSLQRLQPRFDNRHAVFFAHPREAIEFQYERNPDDPRITHTLTLEVDTFGNVLKEAHVGYGRRRPHPHLSREDRDRQAQTLVTYTEHRMTKPVDDLFDYRNPLPCEIKKFELTGYNPEQRFTLDDFVQPDPEHPGRVIHRFDEELSFEEKPTLGKQRRLISHERIFYRPDDLGVSAGDPLALLPLGELQARAIPGEAYQLAFTKGLLQDVYRRNDHDGNRETLIAEPQRILGGKGTDAGGYVDLDGDGNWWIPSGRVFYIQKSDATPAEELDYARNHFFLPSRFRDPFHDDDRSTERVLDYDDYNLLIREICDTAGNRITAGERNASGELVRPGNDYRVLQPSLVMDPNRNRTAVLFDALGMVVASAVMGKPEESLGDSLDGVVADLPESRIEAAMNQPLDDPQSILGTATSRIAYDLFAYVHTKDQPRPQPPAVCTIVRETHQSELNPGDTTKVQISFTYSDGFGREIQQKMQAEPDPETADKPRWVGTGWKVYDNKGNPVLHFEPFFTDTHRYEADARVGVSPIYFYDPLDRLVGALHPNHTWEKFVFSPWDKQTWDVNDTVLISDPTADPHLGAYFERLPDAWYLPTWYNQRISGDLGPEEKEAAEQTAVHAATPVTAHGDPLGREFLTVAHNRYRYSNAPAGEPPEESTHVTRIIRDIQGNELAVIDPEGRIAMLGAYDLLGNRIYGRSPDSGERWILPDAFGSQLYSWDSRGHRFRTAYDPLRRPVATYLQSGHDPELLLERTLYGEFSENPDVGNVRGQVVRIDDQAGRVRYVAYDFKGNPLRTERQLSSTYNITVDWSATVSLESEVYTSRVRYDALNRPIELVAPDQSRLIPTYNEAGLLERSELIPTAVGDETPASKIIIANVDYDAKGRRVRMIYGNGVVRSYEYDPLTFRLVNMQTRRSRDAFPDDCPDSPRSGWPGCYIQNLHYTYDPVGNITRIRDHAQQTIFFNNRRVEPSSHYTYDAIYRLIEATGREHLGQTGGPVPYSDRDAHWAGSPHPGDGNAMGAYTERYRYDAVGNILELIHRGNAPAHPGWKRTFHYEHDSPLGSGLKSNRLTGTNDGGNSLSYFYDEHGNMTGTSHLSLIEWNEKDRLRATSRQFVEEDSIPETTWYVYDAAGERVRKVTEHAAVAGQTPARKAERIYLGAFEIYREYDADGTLVKQLETLHVADQQLRVARVETRRIGEEIGSPQTILYQIDNHVGSAAIELDEKGLVVSYEEYTPFGNSSYRAVAAQLEAPKRYRYKGKERDEENGFYYHGARYYAPWLCRWTSVDPLAVEALWQSPYAAYDNNPVMLVDPDGKQATGNEMEPRRPGDARIHEVKRGETLSGIARSYGVTADQLAQWNAIENPDRIAAGSTLIVSDPADAEAEAEAFGDEIVLEEYEEYEEEYEETYTEYRTVKETVTEHAGGDIMAAGLAAGLVVSQLDSPLPGPGDAAGLLIVGGAAIAAGAALVFFSRTQTRVRTEPITRTRVQRRTRRRRQRLTYVTYTKVNPTTGEIYVGRSSGYGDPRSIVAARDRSHHMTARGFGPAVLDQYTVATRPHSQRHQDPAYQAIRGREQQMIDALGGSWSDVGRGNTRSGNAIRGVSKINPRGRTYHAAASAAFGQIAGYTGY